MDFEVLFPHVAAQWERSGTDRWQSVNLKRFDERLRGVNHDGSNSGGGGGGECDEERAEAEAPRCAGAPLSAGLGATATVGYGSGARSVALSLEELEKQWRSIERRSGQRRPRARAETTRRLNFLDKADRLEQSTRRSSGCEA